MAKRKPGSLQSILSCYLNDHKKPQTHLVIQKEPVKIISDPGSRTGLPHTFHQIVQCLETAESIMISRNRPGPSQWIPGMLVFTISASWEPVEDEHLHAIIARREYDKLLPFIVSIQGFNQYDQLHISRYPVNLFDEKKWQQIYLPPNTSSKEYGGGTCDVKPRRAAFEEVSLSIIQDMLRQSEIDVHTRKYWGLASKDMQKTLSLALAHLKYGTEKNSDRYLGTLLHPKQRHSECCHPCGVAFNHGKNLLLLSDSESRGLMILFEKKTDGRVDVMLLDVGVHTPLWLGKLLPFKTDHFWRRLTTKHGRRGRDHHETPVLYRLITNVKQLMTWAMQGVLPPETSLFELLDLIKHDDCLPFELVWNDGSLALKQIASVMRPAEAAIGSSIAASSSSGTENLTSDLRLHSIFSTPGTGRTRPAEYESNALRQAKCFTALLPDSETVPGL